MRSVSADAVFMILKLQNMRAEKGVALFFLKAKKCWDVWSIVA